MKYNLLGQPGPEGEINPNAPEAGKYTYDFGPGTPNPDGDVNPGMTASGEKIKLPISGGGSGGGGGGGGPERTISEGTTIAQALYSFLPDAVIQEFAKSWVKTGQADVAIGMTRQTKAWKDNFGKLMRDDGTLVMDEMTFMSTKASYKQTLAEVGINDFTDFEDEFTDMATGFGTDDPVSAEEFQARIDMVYAGVENQIPEVEKLFRERYNISLDAPTIFGALINPKIQDKVLAGDISTLQLQAQASSRGFTTTFARFQELKNLGLTQDQAQGIYSGARSFMSQAASVGRDLDISTLEDAALGNTAASQRLQRIQAEITSTGGYDLGAAKKGDEVIGLITN